MMTGLRFSKSLPIAVILTACCVALLVWCSDPQADQRARFCKRAGMKPEVVRECGRSQEDFNRIMEPIRARQHREEGADFNAALQAVPLRSIPKDRYETISLEVLNSKHHCCMLDYTDATEAPKHPLFGKHFIVDANIMYFPTDFDTRDTEHIGLEMQDAVHEKNTWHLDADFESLSREERAFIRSQCKVPYTPDGCAGQFFGVIGRIERGNLEVLGLQIEYLMLSPRDLKKSS